MLRSITVERLGECDDRECKAPTHNFIPIDAPVEGQLGYYFCVPCMERDQELEANYSGA
jgi:hypothetical protein